MTSERVHSGSILPGVWTAILISVNSYFRALSFWPVCWTAYSCHRRHFCYELAKFFRFSSINPLSAAGFDALPLRVKFKKIKLADFILGPLLLATWATYLCESPSKLSLWSISSSLVSCAPSNLSLRMSTFSATADRRSPFADRWSHIVELSQRLCFGQGHSKSVFCLPLYPTTLSKTPISH